MRAGAADADTVDEEGAAEYLKGLWEFVFDLKSEGENEPCPLDLLGDAPLVWSRSASGISSGSTWVVEVVAPATDVVALAFRADRDRGCTGGASRGSLVSFTTPDPGVEPDTFEDCDDGDSTSPGTDVSVLLNGLA